VVVIKCRFCVSRVYVTIATMMDLTSIGSLRAVASGVIAEPCGVVTNYLQSYSQHVLYKIRR
ncbi:MAG TPA: hypothetical protein PK999_19270, partial [Nitrospira sp.]|nr:hypothetical protein [Nitrospira sp.]